MSKANKDGWVRHRGGKQPVDDDVRIDVRLRNGEIFIDHFADGYAWPHRADDGDIMAWRPHKTVEQRIIEAEQSALADKCNEEAEMPAAKYFDGPIQWRDRIREIDAATISLNEERASLVAKLKAEGFVLIQSDEPNSEDESAQQDIAQQDMSDPANWRVGDLFEITGEDSHRFPMGELVKLIVFENDHDESNGHRYAYLDGRDYWWVRDCNVRFHSRPTQ